MAFAIAQAGLGVYQGIQERRYGSATKREYDKAAAEAEGRASFLSRRGAETAYDTLRESNAAQGSHRAAAAKAGVKGGSVVTQRKQIAAARTRKLELMSLDINERMRQLYTSARSLRKRGKQEKRAGRTRSYVAFGQAGLTAGIGAYKAGYFGKGQSLLSGSGSTVGPAGGGSQQTSWGQPYIPR